MDHLQDGTHQLWNPESQMYLVARLESYENDHGVYPYAEFFGQRENGSYIRFNWYGIGVNLGGYWTMTAEASCANITWSYTLPNGSIVSGNKYDIWPNGSGFQLAIHNTTKKFGIQGTQVAFVDTSVKATKESQYTWTSNASDTSSYVTNCTV